MLRLDVPSHMQLACQLMSLLLRAPCFIVHDALAMRCSQWWVGYLLGPNESYLNKGPSFLDPRWAGPRRGCPCSLP